MVRACDFGQKTQRGATSCLSGKTGIGTRPCSCTANLAHVHENWAKTCCAHVILAKKRSAGQHRVKRTFGQKRASVPDLAHVHENWAKTWCAHVISAKKRSARQTSCKMDFRAKRASVPDLAH